MAAYCSITCTSATYWRRLILRLCHSLLVQVSQRQTPPVAPEGVCTHPLFTNVIIYIGTISDYITPVSYFIVSALVGLHITCLMTTAIK